MPVVRINHIGSTAIQGIWAKNIVDVMVEIPQSVNMKDMAQILEQNDFTIMFSEENRISLNKIEKHFLDAAGLAMNNKKYVMDIVINAFTDPFVVPREMIGVINAMPSSFGRNN